MRTTERSPEEIRAILDQLVDLQEIDREIIQLRRQMATLPPRLRALDDRLREEEKAVEELGAGTTDTRKERRGLEQEVQDLEARMETEKVRAMSVKTNEELAAVNKEIEVIEKKIDARETRILEMIEAEEDHERKVAEARSRLEQIRAGVDQEKKRIEEQIRSKKEKIGRRNAAREQQQAKVPPDVLALYDRLAQRLGGNVVVEADGNHCGGCHINLVTQKILEIRQMKKIIQCEGCLRIFSGVAEKT